MSSHEDRINKEEVVDRSMSSHEQDRITTEEIVDKVDPSKVYSSLFFPCYIENINITEKLSLFVILGFQKV